MKTVRGVAETKLTVENLLKGHNCGKNQLSITSIKYYHLQGMETRTGKFHQNPLVTVGGVAETRFRTDGRMDGQTHYYSSLRLMSGYNNTHCLYNTFKSRRNAVSVPQAFISEHDFTN